MLGQRHFREGLACRLVTLVQQSDWHRKVIKTAAIASHLVSAQCSTHLVQTGLMMAMRRHCIIKVSDSKMPFTPDREVWRGARKEEKAQLGT